MRVRIGLGALSNKHFEHTLFPLRTPHDQYLPRYAARFDVLELAALYHIPKPDERMLRWADQAPPDFTFSTKLHKSVVAPQAYDDGALQRAQGILADAAPVRSRPPGPVVAQFPGRFKCTDTNIAWLERLLDVLPRPAAVELRDRSWWHPTVQALLEDARVALVWGTHPRAPAPAWVTADHGYVRFVGKHHDRRGRHVSVEDRLETLLDMRQRLAEEPWRRCTVIVTNTFEGNAIDSLPRIAAALGQEDLARACRRPPGGTLLADPAPGSSGSA